MTDVNARAAAGAATPSGAPADPADPDVYGYRRGSWLRRSLRLAMPGRWLKPFWLVTIGATVVCGGRAGYAIDRRSIWFDEGVTASLVGASWRPMFEFLWKHETNMALYTVALKVWTGDVGGSIWPRLPSAAAVTATVPVLAVVGRRLVGETAASTAAVLLAVNALVLHYGQEMRSYALTIFLVTVGCYALLRLLDATGRRRTLAWSLGWGLVAAAATWTHVMAVLAVGAMVAGAFVLRGHWRRVALRLAPGILVVALLVAPLAARLHDQGARRLSWVPPLTADALVPTLSETVGAVGSSPLLWLYLACVVLGLVAGRRERGIWFVALFGLGTLLAAMAVSLAAASVFLPRYLVVVVPGVTLLAAAGIASLRHALPRGVALAMIVAFAVVAGDRYNASPSAEDYRGAADVVLNRPEPGDGIAFFHSALQPAFALYAVDRAPSYLVPRVEPGRSMIDTPYSGGVRAEMALALSNPCTHPRIWVVTGHDNWPSVVSERDDFIVGLGERGYRLVETDPLRNVLVRLYAITDASHCATGRPRVGPAA